MEVNGSGLIRTQFSLDMSPNITLQTEEDLISVLTYATDYHQSRLTGRAGDGAKTRHELAWARFCQRLPHRGSFRFQHSLPDYSRWQQCADPRPGLDQRNVRQSRANPGDSAAARPNDSAWRRRSNVRGR